MVGAHAVLRLKLAEAVIVLHSLPELPAQAGVPAGACGMATRGDVVVAVTHCFGWLILLFIIVFISCSFIC